MHALSWPGDRSLRKVVGLVRPRPSWSKGASGTIAPLSAGVHGGDSGHERAVLLRFGWLYLLAISLANKNGVFFKFLKRFCQVFTPNTKQVSCSGWRIEWRIWTDSCITHYCMTYFTIYRQSRCPIYGTLCSNGLMWFQLDCVQFYSWRYVT